MKHKFYSSCVDWPKSINSLNIIIDNSIEITRKTFLSKINKEELKQIEKELGYDSHWKQGGLLMCNDWHVSYHKSKLGKKTVYYFSHSSIEYIFI